MVRSALSASAVILFTVGAAHAGVRVIHASPNTPAVDVYVNEAPDGSPAIGGLGFTQATGYVGLASGLYDFRVTPANSNTVALSATGVPLDGNVNYSVAAIGFATSLSPLLLVDNNVAPAAGNARVRFVHAAPDVPQVDIALNLSGTAGSVLFNDVNFGTAASEGYIEVPAGSYGLGVFLGSTLALPVNVTLAAGEAYSVFAMGSLATNDVQAVVFSDPVPAPGGAVALALAGLLSARRRR